MTDRVPATAGKYSATISAADLAKMNAGEAFTIILTLNDGADPTGTPYNKASVLPDTVAAVICPSVSDPTPADAFSGLADMAQAAQDAADAIVSGSSTAAKATTATKLGSNAGSATKPVYFSGGIPVAVTQHLTASLSGTTLTITSN